MQISAPYQTVPLDAVPDISVLEAQLQCIRCSINELADYTAAQVGSAPKTPITQTGWAFCGIESSSILEPIMKLYHLTEKPAYLELARHIVEETGCCAHCHPRDRSRESALQRVIHGAEYQAI